MAIENSITGCKPMSEADERYANTLPLVLRKVDVETHRITYYDSNGNRWVEGIGMYKGQQVHFQYMA